MNKPNNTSESAFVSIYGQKALDNMGFTMVPNDLLENLGMLDLTPSDKLIMIEILRLGNVRCGARKLAMRAGLSIAQTRASYRKLAILKLITRTVEEQGDVNTFNTRGITNLVRGYADLRHRGIAIANSGIVVSDEAPMKIIDTNKDSKDIERNKDGEARADQVDGAGYLKAKEIAEKIKHRKKE